MGILIVILTLDFYFSTSSIAVLAAVILAAVF
jgi:hypothetical protein